MRNIKFYFMFILILRAIFFNTCVFATDSSLVKIGLYYSSSARSEYTVSSSDGLYAADENASELFNLKADSVKVETDGKYHLRLFSGLDISEASEKIAELEAEGKDIFPVSCEGGYEIWSGSFVNEDEALAASVDFECETQTVFPTSNRIVFSGTDDGKNLYISENKAIIASYSGKTSITAVATKEYRGAMLFVPSDGGSLNAINLVDTEEYLYSVISREMSPSWHKEALKAQAVCARNYVAQNKGKHSSHGFDLCDSVCCQAYAGTSSEAEGSYAPVDETKGKLLMYGDEIAQVFYCSSIGPTTEDVKYVWGSDYPYLTSVDNSYEDYKNVYNGVWENTLTKERATEIMNSKGYNVGTVTEIKALEYSPNNRVIKLLVKGTNGEKIFERESCRIVFSEVTLSQYYTISGGGSSSSLPSKFLIIGCEKNKVDCFTQDATAKSTSIISAGENKKTKTLSLPSSFSVIGKGGTRTFGPSQTESSDVYTFSGIGWGHGIGMSQYGAKAMAEAGLSYEDILTHYFNGCEIE